MKTDEAARRKILASEAFVKQIEDFLHKEASRDPVKWVQLRAQAWGGEMLAHSRKAKD